MLMAMLDKNTLIEKQYYFINYNSPCVILLIIMTFVGAEPDQIIIKQFGNYSLKFDQEDHLKEIKKKLY